MSRADRSASRSDDPTDGFARDEAGAAIIEFALVLPILLLLVAGCFEIGRAVLIRHAMEAGVRGGARYLARAPEPGCSPECSAGAAHAVAMTRAVILENSGLATDAVKAAPLPSPPAGTVAMTAEVALGSDLLVLIGLDRVLTLRAAHREARVAE